MWGTSLGFGTAAQQSVDMTDYIMALMPKEALHARNTRAENTKRLQAREAELLDTDQEGNIEDTESDFEDLTSSEKARIKGIIRHLFMFRDSLAGNVIFSFLAADGINVNTNRIKKLKGTTSFSDEARKRASSLGLRKQVAPAGLAPVSIAYPGLNNLQMLIKDRASMVEVLETILGYALQNHPELYYEVLKNYMIATNQELDTKGILLKDSEAIVKSAEKRVEKLQQEKAAYILQKTAETELQLQMAASVKEAVLAAAQAQQNLAQAKKATVDAIKAGLVQEAIKRSVESITAGAVAGATILNSGQPVSGTQAKQIAAAAPALPAPLRRLVILPEGSSPTAPTSPLPGSTRPSPLTLQGVQKNAAALRQKRKEGIDSLNRYELDIEELVKEIVHLSEEVKQDAYEAGTFYTNIGASRDILMLTYDTADPTMKAQLEPIKVELEGILADASKKDITIKEEAGKAGTGADGKGKIIDISQLLVNTKGFFKEKKAYIYRENRTENIDQFIQEANIEYHMYQDDLGNTQDIAVRVQKLKEELLAQSQEALQIISKIKAVPSPRPASAFLTKRPALLTPAGTPAGTPAASPAASPAAPPPGFSNADMNRIHGLADDTVFYDELYNLLPADRNTQFTKYPSNRDRYNTQASIRAPGGGGSRRRRAKRTHKKRRSHTKRR
jgi:hypothetical protein